MIVEDDEDTAEMISTMARALGHHVEWAPTGGMAMTIAASFDPEVVFVDLSLPDIDGFEVTRRLRVAGDRRRPLISALTGWTAPKAWEEAAAAGFDHYLVKPVTCDDLARVISRKPAAGQRRRRSDGPRAGRR